ncbi:putative BRCT domain-containing protein [Helianthus annuus]|uniref:uncharacterized protein LOC110940153 n=1 Tax=Helianthus annuus TaxID=4232 RepID=UPI000B8FCF4D|nr:uncharacterized protein LOC110940153 [Helianthus annuus]KAJ0569245.1 putative BRCT domain-containing protein [Helianthus annuus]KAJ0583553.1 putative BRCT domain-containing protein [Helianthus annuus]KAJ0746283.1 putative BRCT domain-containing protein [Helianthus annuus]KAJ0749285.1 putative BRCT domain-containing protein [Helianthus annuus]KAJ0917739.1 putative BRCT domain-containing protein [Helianthus annuus]
MVGSGRMEVVTTKGCSKMYTDIGCAVGSASFRDFQPPRVSTSGSPFSGLIICVPGLSKEARKQVMDATERLGGQFCPHFHPHCTHLVVQSSLELKSENVLKHGEKQGAYIVTLGWFVDSVRRNERLNESLYGVKSFGENYMAKDNLNRTGSGNPCIPVAMLENVTQCNLIPRSRLHSPDEQKRRGSVFSGQTFYVDPDVSVELRNKVVKAAIEEGAMVIDRLLFGHDASHVVCEGSSVLKYLGHSNNLVTPQWVMKTVKETRSQRLVHLSADLARHIGTTLGNVPRSNIVDVSRDEQNYHKKLSHKENQRIAILAKEGVRNRRGNHTQLAGQKPVKTQPRSILLDSINWTMSEPSSTASIYMDSFSLDDANESINGPDACFVNFSRPLSEREKNELVFRNHFITILFPVDRLGEMGPTSRTFFSDTGFKRTQLLDHIYSFYQENMSTSEIELAIHTDSRHADKLRSKYSSKEAAECGFLKVKRIDFLGSRRIFKMLKHVPGNYGNNVYELLTRA